VGNLELSSRQQWEEKLLAAEYEGFVARPSYMNVERPSRDNFTDLKIVGCDGHHIK
jgi:hypothetical protein